MERTTFGVAKNIRIEKYNSIMIKNIFVFLVDLTNLLSEKYRKCVWFDSEFHNILIFQFKSQIQLGSTGSLLLQSALYVVSNPDLQPDPGMLDVK